MADTQIPGTDDEDASLNASLDAALRDYLSPRLDGQLGRSAAHFHAYLRGASSRGRSASPGGGWVVGIVGAALAASIAALWAGPSLRIYTPPGPGGTSGETVAGPTPVARTHPDPGMDLRMEEQTLSRQTRDGGTVVLDGGTAARRIIRRELKQTRWVDPRTGASLETIEPRQDIRLIQVDTY